MHGYYQPDFVNILNRENILDRENVLDRESALYRFEFIQALNILDRICVRKKVTRNIALTPGLSNYRPFFTFEGIDNFSIVDVKLISATDLDKKLSLKNIDLLITSKYNLVYSDGVNNLIQTDESAFELEIDRVYYPESKVKYFTTRPHQISTCTTIEYGSIIDVEAFGCSFGVVLCSCTGALIVDIGAFFIISFGQKSQLCIPCYRDSSENNYKNGGVNSYSDSGENGRKNNFENSFKLG